MKLLQRVIHWFLPSELHFFDYTDQAADATERAGKLLAELARAQGRENQLKLVDAIRDCEHEADEAMARMSEALQQTFVTPIDREDLYLLVSSVENVSDFISATANQLSVHNLWQMPAGSQELADLVAKSTTEIHIAVKLLRGNRSNARIMKAVKDIGYMEHESDVIFRLRVGDLFANEKDAIELIKIKEFLEGLEDTVDRCHSVAKVLETIAIKHG
jgi:uncharacterized protein Yka (UPF0111/DUF47 family)